MIARPFLALAAMLAAAPVLAQEADREPAQPPGGFYGGPPPVERDFRARAQEQQARLAEEEGETAHPGTLRKFHSSSDSGPVVQFDLDREKAAEERER